MLTRMIHSLDMHGDSRTGNDSPAGATSCCGPAPSADGSCGASSMFSERGAGSVPVL